MKKLLLGIAAACLAGFTFAQDAPLWMRHSVISPDGTTIAFTYKGDIYTVPVAGGRAMQITTNPAYDTAPVWSPDSKRIAFASDRMGSLDVYIVAKDGGEPRRLTTHSGSETPLAFTDAGHVLFSAGIMPSAEAVVFPSNGQFNQVYRVSVEGGRPTMISSMPMECISIIRRERCCIKIRKVTRTTGVNITYRPLPVTSGCILREKNRSTAS